MLAVVSFPDFALVERRFFQKVRNERKKDDKKGNGTTKDKDANNIADDEEDDDDACDRAGNFFYPSDTVRSYTGKRDRTYRSRA